MYYIEQIKNGIEKLYKTDPNVHVTLSRFYLKYVVESSPAKIVGVYKNIFQIEECVSGNLPTRHTFRYGDVLTGQVKIEELDYVPKNMNKK